MTFHTYDTYENGSLNLLCLVCLMHANEPKVMLKNLVAIICQSNQNDMRFWEAKEQAWAQEF